MSRLKKIVFLPLFIITQIFATTPEAVKKHIENILSKLPSSTKAAIIILKPLTQDTIFKLNASESMIPASNTKLFTTAAALSLLGGNFILSTKLLTDDKSNSSGAIRGNLYIKGYGNSLFTSSDMDALVDVIKKEGIKKITGNIVGDDSFCDNIYSRKDWIYQEEANVKLPPVSALVVDRNRKIIYKRRRHRLRAYYVNVSNPPLNAARMLKAKLERKGIHVSGKTVAGVTPAKAKFLAESKITLRELIKKINKHSDNFLAECLFKTIGAVTSGKQGNSFYATQAVVGFIRDQGIFSKGTSVVDGSGISRFDQITVGAIAGTLEKMYFDLKHYTDYYNSLSIAGVDGTLRDRMVGTAAENNFRGKTGTLKGVTSLSGYLTTNKNEKIIISMIFQFQMGETNLHRKIEDEIVEALTALE